MDSERAKNENLGIELVYLVNENKALQQDTTHNTRKAGDLGEEYSRLERKFEKGGKELHETKEALLTAKGEIERLKTELIRYELSN